MNARRILKSILGVVGIFSLATLAVGGCQRFASADQRVSYARDHLRDKFDLTEEQVQILDKALNAAKAVSLENKALNKLDIASLRSGIEKGGTIDKQEFSDAYAKRRAILDKHFETIANSLSELSGTLNPEQRKELSALLTKIENRTGRFSH